MKKLFTLLSVTVVATVLYLYPTDFGEGSIIDGVSSEPQKLESIAFTNVSVIPMTNEGLILENHTVIIEGDRIISILPDSKIKFKPETKIIDGTGKYLIPGLAEMHGHVPPTHPSVSAPSYFNDEYVENTLFLYVAEGITTVRGMLGYDHQLELKDRVNSGELIGPNLYLAGPSFNGNSVTSPEQAIRKVIQQKEEGWDLLKIHPGLTLSEYNAMAKKANELGITFGGHVPAEVGIERAIDAGQLTIDHIDGYVAYLNTFEGAERDSEMGKIIQKTLEKNVWIVPTQALWETILGAADFEMMMNYDELKYIPKTVKNGYENWASQNVLENPNFNLDNALKEAEVRQELLSKMSKAGVKILMGTDAPQLFSVPGFSIHRELPKMIEAGMSPYQVLVSGTANVGEYFKMKDDFGTIEPEKRADLILVNANPLEDIANIRNNAGVMVRGEWFSKDMIDKRLAEIEVGYR